MKFTKQRIRLLLVIGVILGIIAAPVIAALIGGVPTSGTIPLDSNSGPTVYVEGASNMSLDAPFADANTVNVTTDSGNATVSATGNSSLHITASNITGTWTYADQIQTNGNQITIDPADKPAVTVAGDINTIEFTTMQLDDGNPDFVYSGSSPGTSTVVARGLPANTQIAAVNATTKAVIDVATSDGSGTVTFDDLENSEHTVELLNQNDSTAPILSNPSPTGNVSSEPSQISIDVGDADFPSDNVTVNITFEGTQIHSEAVTSNTTLTTSNFTANTIGETYNWTATASDAYGHTATSSNSFNLPENITFRNETNASQIITGANATVTFYSPNGQIVIQRTDTDGDGNISLKGLPNSAFVVTIQADGYYNRRVYIESIFQQQNIYLLNSTAYPNAINTTFVYEDRTGNFPSEDTTLRIQRAVDVNNDSTYEWTTIAGDFWGAAGEFPFTGQQNARYRLIIENDGTQRVLGTHIPTEDGVKNIVVGRITWPYTEGEGRTFNAELVADQNKIQAVYIDPTNKTTDIRIRVWEPGNQSNIIHDQTYSSGPYGTLIIENISLTANQTEQSWIVNYTATHSVDGQLSGQQPVGGNPFGLPVNPWLLGSIGYAFLTFIPLLYGPRTALMGAWALTGAAAIIMIFQWFTIPTASFVVMIAVPTGATLYRQAFP